MSYEVIPTEKFLRLAKRLQKKYPSLRNDLRNLGQLLSANPLKGIPLGQNLYKIRLAIASKGKGKSGGARIITYVISENQEIFLIHIFDKSELDNITPSEIIGLMKEAGLK